MAITPYCQQADVQAVLSAFALNVRLDDDLDGVADIDVGQVIEQATTRVNQFVLRRYAVQTAAASTWLKWCVAVIAATIACRRRGNEVPDALIEEVKDYREQLEAIRAGQEDLPADDGPAIPLSDETPAVSNLTIDERFPRAKVRRVPRTSSGGPQTNNDRMQNNTVDNGWWLWI